MKEISFESKGCSVDAARMLAAPNDKTLSASRVNNDNERAQQWRNLSGRRASSSCLNTCPQRVIDMAANFKRFYRRYSYHK